MEKYTLKDFGRDVVPVYGAIKNIKEENCMEKVSLNHFLRTCTTIVYNAILLGVPLRLRFGNLEEMLR